MSLIAVAVHSTYKNFSGDKAGGQVEFKPVAAAFDTATTFTPLPVTAPVVDGELQVTLMAPEAAGDTPLEYRVTEKLAPATDGANTPTYSIQLPGGAGVGAVFELSDRDATGLLPVPSGTGDTSGVFGADGTFG